MAYQFIDPFILGGRNRYNRNAEHGFHGIDVNSATVACQFVHHIQGHYHGDVHLEKLHGKIQVTLNVGGIYNIDDSLWLAVQNKVTGDNFFTGIGGHGVDSGQVCDGSVAVTTNGTVFPIDRYTGKVADMLIGACELIEQCCLSAVLVPCKSKGKNRSLRKRVTGAFRMKSAFLTETGMVLMLFPGRFFFRSRDLLQRRNADFFRICKTQSKFIPMDLKLHRIPHRSQLDHRDLCAGDHAHIQKMLTQSAFSADLFDTGGLAGFQFIQFVCQGFHLIPFPRETSKKIPFPMP